MAMTIGAADCSTVGSMSYDIYQAMLAQAVAMGGAPAGPKLQAFAFAIATAIVNNIQTHAVVPGITAGAATTTVT